MTTRRPRIAKEALGALPELARPLNEAFDAISDRIDALSPRLVSIAPVEFATGAAVAAGTVPFPLRLSVGKASLVSLLVGRVENLTSGAVLSAGVFPDWRLLTDGQAEVRFLTGLSTSTRYRVRFVGVV